MERRTRRSLVPGVNGLEDRSLQTVISPVAFGRSTTAADVVSNDTSVGSPSPSAFLDPATLTPRGLAQAKFSAVIVGGPFKVRSAVFNSQLADLTFIGRVSSNQFLHGTLVMHVETPNSPTGITAGGASLRDRSVAATGTSLGIDPGGNATKTAGPNQQVPTILDAKGRPIQLGFNVDTNTSGGSYAGSIGQGVITIAYRNNGTASLRFTGYVLRNGVTDITSYTLSKFS